jgi:hypothetical protein
VLPGLSLHPGGPSSRGSCPQAVKPYRVHLGQPDRDQPGTPVTTPPDRTHLAADRAICNLTGAWFAADTDSGGCLAAVALGSSGGRAEATSDLSYPARPVRVRAVLEWGML